jgi:hypothetical protein
MAKETVEKNRVEAEKATVTMALARERLQGSTIEAPGAAATRHAFCPSAVGASQLVFWTFAASESKSIPAVSSPTTDQFKRDAGSVTAQDR